jgi:serine phosphatase RsbU (regulator of sigma subunit)
MTNQSSNNRLNHGFWAGVRREFRELRESFLDKNQKTQLETMGRFKRALYLTGWLIKILFKRLSKTRRILLIVGLFFLLISRNDSNSSGYIIGGAILLFIIMLELKDKLLARDELQEGRAVQNALLPERSPKIPGWDIWLFTRPANDVGGDLVDYVKINDNRYGFAIGDVAGKGLPAALFMAKLQAILRALAPDFKSITKLGQKINEIFCRDGLPTRFVSLVYVVIDSEKKKLNLFNAGHMPPVILKNGKVEELSKGGPALGLTKDAEYYELNVPLKQEDLLLVYSDGLTEARNEKGEFFGTKRLLEIFSECKGLKTEQIGEKLLTELDRFIGEANAHDDLSLLIIKQKTD